MMRILFSGRAGKAGRHVVPYLMAQGNRVANVDMLPSDELMTRFFPGVPVTRKLDTHEAIFSNRRIRDVLGFVEEHDWRQYVKR